jgi:hypothetical protein
MWCAKGKIQNRCAGNGGLIIGSCRKPECCCWMQAVSHATQTREADMITLPFSMVQGS